MRKLLFIFLILFSISSYAINPNPDKLSVILDWFPNPDHAPLIVAKQQGFFAEENLDVELIGPADPNDAPKLVAANKADIGITYQPEYMQQVDKGLPLIRIGTLIDKPLNCLVILKDQGMTKLADLKGKRVGSSAGGLTHLMLKIMLQQQGLTENDVELVNVKYNLTQALLSHKVDAVTGMMRNFEVPLLESHDHKVRAFFPEEHGIPTYSELIYISHLDNVNDKRFPRFLTALRKAVRYLDEHPTESWKAFIKQYPEANNTVNRQAWFATLPYFSEDPANFSTNNWQNFAAFLQKNEFIKTIQPVSRYAVILR